MTMPSERTRAVNHTREFLYSLLDPKVTPRIPKYIRDEAYRLLRHFPTQLDMELVSEREMGTHFVQRTFGQPEVFK